MSAMLPSDIQMVVTNHHIFPTYHEASSNLAKMLFVYSLLSKNTKLL